MGHIVTALKRSVSLLVPAIPASAAGGGQASAEKTFKSPKLKGPAVIKQSPKCLEAMNGTGCLYLAGFVQPPQSL
ncbi:hypothetical protein RLPCCGM1_p0058 [Rhizobium leguminosarum bv. phaseoli CCGM1]|uniref:Uncharacterized protein n=1 Tax=Rhizobium phaseoli TaxID=396 RepID=A0ABN4R145_9HYPH|nr:hypothetical protein AMC81_PE00869 [Rhizobium phaseoli]ANL95621.1 hypothetical protein AMC80_PE00869 [Rhizobium phaseoli]KEC71327.1 hypothetical protein RLPCCGM1_p0058 [Rhizobium leguminosarum bv. phaseoli CCGM1]PWI51189.1 hypothetical protein B5K03_26690 [Rhizobium phaseoli]